MEFGLSCVNKGEFHIFKDLESLKDVLEIDTESYNKYWYISGKEVFISKTKESMEHHCITGDLTLTFPESFEYKICTAHFTFLFFEYGKTGELAMTVLNNKNMVDKDRIAKLTVYY